MNVTLYIGNERVDLFDDESISIKLNAKDVRDITQNFGDFSQTFSVPASPTNNKIFSYWWENLLNTDADFRQRVDAFIEVDLIPFRKGKIMLEGVDMVKDEPKSYRVTFYGATRNVKDSIENAKLSDLDYSDLEFEYNRVNVIQRLITQDDVSFALMSTQKLRFWQFGDGSMNDISTDVGAININELFPLVRVSKIIEIIENTYGVQFIGSFLQTRRFTESYQLFKKTESLVNYEEQQLNITGVQPSETVVLQPFFVAQNVLIISQTDPQAVANASGFSGNFNEIAGTQLVQIGVSYASPDVPIFIDMFQIDFETNTYNLTATISVNTSGIYDIFEINEDEISDDTVYTFQARSTQACTLNLSILWVASGSVKKTGLLGGWQGYTIIRTATIQQIIFDEILINLSQQAPDVLIVDWLRDLFKVFNLVIVPLDNNKYYLEPLQDWYNRGRIVDITNTVDIDSIQIDRVPLYEEINFRFEKSKSSVNQAYASEIRKEYGDLTQSYLYDGGKYEVKVMFEMPLFTRFSQGLNVALLLDEKGNPYETKPILLYCNGVKQLSGSNQYKITDGAVTVDVSDYLDFGAELEDNGIKYLLTFSNERSVTTNDVIQNNLSRVYFGQYLSNLYNKKNRLTKLKGYFGIDEITGLRLNDRLVIREKKYIINNVSIDITKGSYTIELIDDFFTLRNAQLVTLDSSQSTYNLNLNMINGANQINVISSLSVTPTTLTDDGIVEITIPPFSAVDIERDDDEDDTRIIEENTDVRILEEQSTSIQYVVTIEWVLDSGGTETQDYIIQVQ